MRTIPPAIHNARAERAGIRVEHLIWIVARDRETGGAEAIGFWTGPIDRQFTISGAVRGYYGAGTALEVQAVTQEPGVQVRSRGIVLSGIAPEVEVAIRQYDARRAPCEIHRAEFSVTTGALLAAPIMETAGEVDTLSLPTPPEGGEYVASLSILSNAAMLTRPLARLRSAESLKSYAPNDGFMRYAGISGTKPDTWGAKNA